MTESTDRMAAARAAKKRGPRTPPGEILRWVSRAFELLAFGQPTAAARVIADEFYICKSSAQNAVNKARNWIRAEVALDREAHLERLLLQIEQTIQAEHGMTRIAAMKLKMELLGLAAPVVSGLVVSTPPFDPAATAAMKDPALRAKLLDVEKEISKFTEDG